MDQDKKMSDKTMTLKDSIASDSTEQLDVESNMMEDSIDSQILEKQSADNLNEEVESENIVEFLEEKVEQDMRDVQTDEEKTGREEDLGNEGFDKEQNNNRDQEDKTFDIDEQESKPIYTDVLSETQKLSDITVTLKESIASNSSEQLDVESNMTGDSKDSQILDTKSADNLNEEGKSENNADFLKGKVKQDTRDVQSDQENTGKKEDPSKEYFDKEQNINKYQEEKKLIDIHEQDSNTIDTDVFSETQMLSNKTMTLKNPIASDSIEQLDVESNMIVDSINSQILEKQSADHLNEEVKSENNADFLKGKVEQDTRDVQSDEENTGKKEDPTLSN
ncbi:uncharacterized protein [Garra rufa]|uniref:uncharacterized protein n=1 Tax=Garra rufa TaxID=137080 RepID=UPI003CCE7A49